MTSTATGPASLYDVAPGYAKPIVTLDVYRRPGSVGATNGGVSSRFTELFLFRSDVAVADVDPRQLDQAVVINVRYLMGDGATFSIEPLIGPAGTVGPMFGGNYAATSDSRFSGEVQRISNRRFYGAMAIHDRFETQEQYDRLSR